MYHATVVHVVNETVLKLSIETLPGAAWYGLRSKRIPLESVVYE